MFIRLNFRLSTSSPDNYAIVILSVATLDFQCTRVLTIWCLIFYAPLPRKKKKEKKKLVHDLFI